MMNLNWSLILLLTGCYLDLVVKSTAQQFNPLKDPHICGRPKCEAGGKFNYKPAVKYKYLYAVDIDTLFVGTSKNSSTLHVDSFAVLEFNGRCEGTVSFEELRLSERENEGPDHEHSELFADAIIKYPLRFSYHDGIVTELCPSLSEPSWVLNFKRGFLTLLHNTMQRFDLDHEMLETDVHGTCQTKYTLKGARNTSLIIEKTKNIMSCQDRYKHQSILQTTPYIFRSNYEVIPIIKSTVNCQLSVDHYVYNEIICHETHVFQPFSNNASGASTIARQKLVLIDEIDGTFGYEEQQPKPIEHRTNLLFNHLTTPKPTSGELRESRDLIKKLCQLNTDDMQIEFSSLFTKFIHTSRMLSFIGLEMLYNRASIICNTGRKHIMDSLPFLGSNAAVELMKNIIISGDVTQDIAHEWLIGISFIPRPDETMLISLLDLLRHNAITPKNYDPTIPLSVATVAHSYCRNKPNCGTSAPINDIVKFIEDKAIEAYESGSNDRAAVETILVSLKSLANIGIVSNEFELLIWDMIDNDEFSTEIRVAAVDAHRRLPCMKTRDRFLKLFRNQNIDSEVRIAAYLQVMRCPDYVTVRIIRHCLEVEEVNQVGSFVWSHLQNLLKSSIPSRVEIQGLLSDKGLGTKYNSDVRKFSHNYEKSIFFDEYNIGGNYESNVIFSTNSYVPKSAMLNMTVDLFGESVNLLEVNGRIEGFEKYLESTFGPKGPLNARYFEEKISKIRWPRHTLKLKENEVLKNEIDNLPNIVTNKFGEPRVSFGVKVFGNELKFYTFNGNQEIKEALKILNPLNYLKRVLSGQEINYNKAAMFLDTNYIVPSGAGLPITLNAVGTAAVNLKMYGSLRAADFMRTKELDLIGSFRPRVTLDVIGTMSVDAYYATTGIKLKTNFYTATAVEGQVKIRGPQLVSVRFSLPNEKTEIFSSQSEIIVMNNNVEKSQEGISTNCIKQTVCSWPVVDKTLGLKFCADYQFPNVTKNKDAPYFLLAGPSKFHVSLQKADPSARHYVFEYRWMQMNNKSVVSVIFDTPGSNVKRLFSVNFTLDVQSQNLTLLFETTAGTTLAKGRYKNTENEKYLYVGLDIDGKRHFDAGLSLNRKESKYGHTYSPKFYLGVKNERVAELNGTLRSVTKKGIQQWDVSLNFQTKRLFTHLFGYVTRSDVSVATKLNLNYRFVNGSNERVHTEFKISDRSKNAITSINADLRLECSAYPQFNFEAALKFQTAEGHVDCKLDVNSMDHLKNRNHTLTAQFVFINVVAHDGHRLNTFIEFRRPSTQLDMKLQFRYEVAGPKKNVLLLARYAKDKDVSVALYLSLPRGTLFFMEGKLNVTLPSFTPMVLEGRLNEITSSKFDVEVNAVWFSGHNFTASGRYEDRSTRIASSYHLKLLIQSPSFREIQLGCTYYSDEAELKLEIKANHNDDIYMVIVKHGSVSRHEMSTYAELRYKEKTYSITSIVNLHDYRQLMLDLHIDTLRDIHIVVRGINTDSQKELGLEIKWDANRDPDQKLMFSIEFDNPHQYNYGGSFVLSYPGRSINGAFKFGIQEYHFETMGRLSWSPTEIIELELSTDYKYDIETLITLKSELHTPFDNWKKTSINGGYRHIENMYNISGNVYWLENQYVSIDLLSNYTQSDVDLKCELSGKLLSTISKIPSVSGRFKHFHNTTKIDTNIQVKYDPKKEIALRSIWEISKDVHMKNLTGTMSLISPFVGYNKGLLQSKIYVTKNRDIKGVVNLDLDHKKYTASLEGYLRRITDNMLFFNITTPIEKYSRLTGRFGFSEQKRHLVAEIRTPTDAVGIEVLFYIVNISDFDVKFILATPIDLLKNALVIAKLKSDRVDFRIGWNALILGFSGIWHYSDLTDFEYSYKIYTPITGLTENGVVAKLILKDGLDTEFLIRLGETKVGIEIVGKPNSKPLKDFGVKIPAAYISSSRSYVDHIDHDTSEQEDEVDVSDGISWTGLVKVDTIIWPTIKGTLDIDQIGSLYSVLVTLSLPHGNAELRDEFYFSDILKMHNTMHILTPYECYKEISSYFNLDIIIGCDYNILFDLNILNKTEWIESSFILHYIHNDDDEEIELHNVTFHTRTPFISLPKMDLNAGLEIEENIYRINFTLTTNTTDILVSGSAESDDGFFETSTHLYVNSPALIIPATDFQLKKDFSRAENLFNLLLNVTGLQHKKCMVKTLWYVKSAKHFNLDFIIDLPIQSLQHFETGLGIFADTDIKSASGRLIVPFHSFNINGTIKENIVNVVLLALVPGERHAIIFNGNVVKISKELNTLSGVIQYGDNSYDVTANMKMYNEIPITMDTELVPKSGAEKIIVRYTVQPQESGCALRLNVQRGNTFANIEAHMTIRHKFDWDLHMQIDTSVHGYNALVNTKMMTPSLNNMSFTFESITPFVGLERTTFGYTLLLDGIVGNLHVFHTVASTKGDIKINWRWLLLEDMSIDIIGNQQIDKRNKDLTLILFYNNPKKKFSYLKFGGDINVDRGIWTLGSNVTLSLPSHESIDIEGHLKLPLIKQDTHSIIGSFHASNNMSQIEYLANYRTMTSKQNYGASGIVNIRNRTNIAGNLKVNWGPSVNQTINNIVDLKYSNKNIYMAYRLLTAAYNEDTVNTKLTYKSHASYYNITAKLFCPESRQITDVKVDYIEMANMNGTVNVTTPFKKLPYAGAHFIMETKLTRSNRRIEAFWPNNTALLDSRYAYQIHAPGSSEASGVLLLDMPLTSRHIVKVDYGYTTKPLHTLGRATIKYNKDPVLEGKYRCDSESRAGYDKDTINVEVENKFAPIGVTYVHQFEYNAPGGGFRLPTVTLKRVQIFNLHNRTKFNVTGEMHITTKNTGKEIILMAIHSNRTVTLNANYDVLDQRFIQKSRLQLAPNVWIAYDFDLINNTMNENRESQQIEINVSYPRRNFTLLGSYAVTNSTLSSEASLVWDKAIKMKSIHTSFDWEQVSALPNHQLIKLEIMHPTFERNVTFNGEYQSTDVKIADVKLEVLYSADPNKKVLLSSAIEDHSNKTIKNYTFEVAASHPATNLELFVKGETNSKHKWYRIHNIAHYKRTYLPLQSAEIILLLDAKNYEIEYQKKTEREPSYFHGKYDGKFPVYTANVSMIRGSEMNSTGKFYFNFKEKLLQLNLNMTEDGSQSFHIYGVIPDARSATFNVWRDYEDIHVSDIAYFLRLNHSRFVVSSVKWRPELKTDIKTAVRVASVDFYNNFTNDLDYWKTYVRSETADAVKDIWQDAKPIMQNFLDDIDGLKVLLDDVEELKIFLNESYQANEFYIRDIVGATMYIIDELSIRSHIESLPAIVNEILEVMGESGEAVRKSIQWAVHTIKESYRKFAEFINNLVRGDSLEQLSELMERFIEKYDKFMKDLHVWFIRYMENLWQQVYVTAIDNWRKMLHKLEPAFITFAHYVESIVYKSSKEILDFLYRHTSEIVESPYFNKFSRFTHDIDTMYKDFMKNDTITLIYNYSTILFNFLKEKYFSMVPFSKELKDIVTEILNELKELKKLSSIQYLLSKLDECYAKVKWFYDYFDVGHKVRSFISIMHSKLTDISMTALQAENRYREAKTNFIFEPNTGTVYLEQKLPMSWHAFNETPKFEEIPEYKALIDLQSYFIRSNTTFWAFYYNYKPYTDPKDWLPPFTAHAFIAGSQHYMTFDKQFYEFSGACTYLLAHDFLDKNFSVAITYDPSNNGSKHILHLLLKNEVIHIDIFANTVAVGNSTISRLPINVEDTFIYWDADILTAESMSGFSLRCNMKFDVCMLDVSGWYFGKTAGLWGTINNEPSDDFLASTNHIEPHIGRFTHSWTLQPQVCHSVTNQAIEINKAEPVLIELCDSLFASKMSPFHVCFERVHPGHFHHMCLNGQTEMQACTSAVAYIQSCTIENTPLRIPDVCVKCNLLNGTEITEGEIIRLTDENIHKTTDIVFIVELKECNADLKNNRNIDSLILSLHKELSDEDITENRYSVVVFGGDGVFDEPRSLVMNNKIFTSYDQISSYFEDFKIGKGNVDIFGAISFATQLVFRPGASKTFILLPCTDCDTSKMKLDYTVLHQLLFENDITLHILMNEEFRFEKTRINKVFFGLDSSLAYTKKDSRILKGDAELRKQVSPPKSLLGHCVPLALETNGTVFTSKKLIDDKRNTAKKFATVFAKRVAKTASPSLCQSCECNAYDNGVSFMECYPCQYPTAYSDYDFNEDDTLSAMQSIDNDEQYDSNED